MEQEKALPQINKPVEYFLERIESFLKGSRKTNRGEIQRWLANDSKLARKGHAALKKEQEITTIMYPRAPRMLNSFFYTPKIRLINNENDDVDLSALISESSDSSILIQGRLGQGKSMLLRYLQFLALNIGETIPIFIEFRKIGKEDNIETAALRKLNDLGFECSEGLYKYLVSKGHLSFFLDGFDESAFDERDRICSDILNLSNKTIPNRIFITSRFHTEINTVVGLEQYDIQPLASDEYPKFISKLINDDEQALEIIKKIEEAHVFDPSVLDTPLLLTWFIMVYQVRRKIPKTKIGFYEELFTTILSRHDGLKRSFNRPSKSLLSDNEIETVLHAFCYLTSKDGKKGFEHKEIIEYIRRALNISRLNDVKAEDYLYDLTNITCLMVKDGHKYDFIHSTIQSYFSACFVKETNESNAKKFYSKAESDRVEWSDELGFLVYLDSYRFHKFMIFPSICNLTGISETKIMKEPILDTVSIEVIKKVYSESCLVFECDSSGPKYLTSMYLPSASYTCHLMFNDANYKFCLTDIKLSTYVDKLFAENTYFKTEAMRLAEREEPVKRTGVTLFDVLNKSSLTKNFYDNILEYTLDVLNSALSNSLKIIKAEESKEGLF